LLALAGAVGWGAQGLQLGRWSSKAAVRRRLWHTVHLTVSSLLLLPVPDVDARAASREGGRHVDA